MNYFKNDKNEIFAYDDEQVKKGYGKDLELLESGEFYDPKTKSIKPYKLDNFLEVKRDKNNNIIYPQKLIDELHKKELDKKIQKWKKERQKKVDNIEVTYDNVVYQGDELSQTRIARAITAMSDSDSIDWIAKDNTIHKLTKDDLKAILLKASQEQAKLWVEGRPE